MRLKARLLATAALAVSFAVPAYAQTTEAPGAKSDITIAADTAPSASVVENSAASESAGIEDNAQGEGVTAKKGTPDLKEGKLPSERSTY